MANRDRYGEPIETPDALDRSDNPLRVRCPWCRAPIGAACTSPATRRVLRFSRAHPSRIDALRAITMTIDEKSVHDALSRKCKLCGAKPGADCTNLTGGPLPGRRIHYYRIEPK